MILIGQYDSPFVRRVAIALRLYGIGFEHRPWSTFGDADRIAPYNPLRRVPTLVLEGGAAKAVADYRAGDRAWRQGGQPGLRARAAQGAAKTLGRALRGADFRRAR